MLEINWLSGASNEWCLPTMRLYWWQQLPLLILIQLLEPNRLSHKLYGMLSFHPFFLVIFASLLRWYQPLQKIPLVSMLNLILESIVCTIGSIEGNDLYPFKALVCIFVSSKLLLHFSLIQLADIVIWIVFVCYLWGSLQSHKLGPDEFDQWVERVVESNEFPLKMSLFSFKAIVDHFSLMYKGYWFLTYSVPVAEALLTCKSTVGSPRQFSGRAGRYPCLRQWVFVDYHKLKDQGVVSL